MFPVFTFDQLGRRIDKGYLMDLTIDQALLQGVAAHRKGQVQDAERLYRAILQRLPSHPDANHNLGLLAVAFNKTNEALPLFKTALEANPKIEQFWLSYIDALIREQNFDHAIRVIDQGKERGIDATKLDVLKAQTVSLSEREGVDRSPSQAQLDNLLEHYQNKSFNDAENLARSLTQEFPTHQFSWKVLGAIFAQTNRILEAVDANQKAIELSPRDAEAHNNLGNTLQELGRLDEAEASANKAISLKSDFAEAHNSLGVILQKRRKYEEAIAAYNEALKLKPDYLDVYWNLGDSLSNHLAKSFSNHLAQTYLDTLNLGITIRPAKLAHPIITLLKYQSDLKEAIEQKDQLSRSSLGLKYCAYLAEIPLLLKIMELCPITDLEIEDLLTKLRQMLLLKRHLLSGEEKLLRFQNALAIQCFTNEFIFEETAQETVAVELLEADLEDSFSRKELLRPHDIACLASYRGLHKYAWAESVIPTHHLEALIKRQVVEVNQELELRKDIPNLNPIQEEVSLYVQNQYEENPFPRWVSTSISRKPRTIEEIARDLRLRFNNKVVHFPNAPQILVAGCGSGQHAIDSASKYKACNVIAIDLSLSSLSHAQRKTKELNISNIEYKQADILDIGLLGKQFDLIESVGVLHHMADPVAGWRALSNCLKPGGLMRIGLYSELARQDVVKARKIIAEEEVSATNKSMRSFRQQIIKEKGPLLDMLLEADDFYSMSSLRDLLFHVQEHRFSLPEIQKILDELELSFSGFEFYSENRSESFSLVYPEAEDIYNLLNWHEYETSNPKTFREMYQFWVQKI